jgi:hypothetical protein
MSRDYKLYLEDVIEAIEKIEAYTSNVSFEQLRENSMLPSTCRKNSKRTLRRLNGAELLDCVTSSLITISGYPWKLFGILFKTSCLI